MNSRAQLYRQSRLFACAQENGTTVPFGLTANVRNSNIFPKCYNRPVLFYLLLAMECKSPPPAAPLPGGQVNVKGPPYVVGTKAEYKCPNGYGLDGIPYRICTGDGTWFPDTRIHICRGKKFGYMSRMIIIFTSQLWMAAIRPSILYFSNANSCLL
jgi:hypothetical protein